MQDAGATMEGSVPEQLITAGVQELSDLLVRTSDILGLKGTLKKTLAVGAGGGAAVGGVPAYFVGEVGRGLGIRVGCIWKGRYTGGDRLETFVNYGPRELIRDTLPYLGIFGTVGFTILSLATGIPAALKWFKDRKRFYTEYPELVKQVERLEKIGKSIEEHHSGVANYFIYTAGVLRRLLNEMRSFMKESWKYKAVKYADIIGKILGIASGIYVLVTLLPSFFGLIIPAYNAVRTVLSWPTVKFGRFTVHMAPSREALAKTRIPFDTLKSKIGGLLTLDKIIATCLAVVFTGIGIILGCLDRAKAKLAERAYQEIFERAGAVGLDERIYSRVIADLERARAPKSTRKYIRKIFERVRRYFRFTRAPAIPAYS